MSFTVFDAEQRSEAWFLARLGRLTSSRAADMMATIKSGEAAGRRNLRAQLVLERITGRRQENDFSSKPMQNGVDLEPDAYGAYESITGNLLERTGFLSHDELMAGCSLDGHCDDFVGLVEIKCPLDSTHFDYLDSGKVPGDYLKQITHALWITGAEWCDFLSFNPHFPEKYRAKLIRVMRADVDIAEYDQKARAFLAEVDRKVAAFHGWDVMKETA